MALHSARKAHQGNGEPRYERHRPEQTLLYQLVERHCPRLPVALGEHDQSLPKYVRDEFEEYLKCGRLEYGFVRLCCEACHQEKLVAFSCKRRGWRGSHRCEYCRSKQAMPASIGASPASSVTANCPRSIE